MTNNVEITTSRPRVPTVTVASHGVGLRSGTRTRDSGTRAPRGPTPLRLPRRNDRTYQGRYMGSSCSTGRMDLGWDPAQHPDVRRGLHADGLSTSAHGIETRLSLGKWRQ